MKNARVMLAGIALLTVVSALGVSPARAEATDAVEAERQLTEVRAQIDTLEQRIAAQAGERGDAVLP